MIYGVLPFTNSSTCLKNSIDHFVNDHIATKGTKKIVYVFDSHWEASHAFLELAGKYSGSNWSTLTINPVEGLTILFMFCTPGDMSSCYKYAGMQVNALMVKYDTNIKFKQITYLSSLVREPKEDV